MLAKARGCCTYETGGIKIALLKTLRVYKLKART